MSENPAIVTKAAEAMGRKDFEAARRILAPYLSRVPHDAEALILAGICEFEAKNFGHACTCLENAIQHGAQGAQVLHYLGLAYEKTDRQEEARVSFELALKSDPNFNPSKLRLQFLTAEEKVAPPPANSGRVSKQNRSLVEKLIHAVLFSILIPIPILLLDVALGILSLPFLFLQQQGRALMYGSNSRPPKPTPTLLQRYWAWLALQRR